MLPYGGRSPRDGRKDDELHGLKATWLKVADRWLTLGEQRGGKNE